MSLVNELRQLLGAELVSDDPEELRSHGGDKWFAHRLPEAVVSPRSTDHVSAALRFAFENHVPVTARGAGYGYVGSCVPVRGGISLSFTRMNRIKEISFADAVA